MDMMFFKPDDSIVDLSQNLRAAYAKHGSITTEFFYSSILGCISDTCDSIKFSRGTM